MCYMGHRRFLPIENEWRLQPELFDGLIEEELPPKILSGSDILEQVNQFGEHVFGKSVKKRKRSKTWLKKSLFFELPYWSTLLLRHNLDVMHIERNVCESVIGTLLNIKGKTKDNLKSRFDLQEMEIRNELHPVEEENKLCIPSSFCTLSLDEKKTFCEYLKTLKVPDGFSSTVGRCVNLNGRKVFGLKSHDYHIIMEYLLPYALQGLMKKEVRDVLINLSDFFKTLCSKVVNVDDLSIVEAGIIRILCKMEMMFPPSFFDIMVHLLIHLPNEVRVGGPVQYRWMYPFERYLSKLKAYVRNRAHPEGSIAEGYIGNECVMFCTRYFHTIETKFNQKRRNEDNHHSSYEGVSIFKPVGRPMRPGKQSRRLTVEEWRQAHLYILKNCDDVLPYIGEHIQGLQHVDARNAQKRHDKEFVEWFESHVTKLYNDGSNEVDKQLLDLSRGPSQEVICYKGYIVNGFRFRIKDDDDFRKTQNSGVVVRGTDDREYFGVLHDIIELQYMGGNKVVMFKCKWWNVNNRGKGIRIDEHGLTSVNMTYTLATNEPFVLACQSEQVFYLEDRRNSIWYFVLKVDPRDYYKIPLNIDEDRHDEDDDEGI